MKPWQKSILHMHFSSSPHRLNHQDGLFNWHEERIFLDSPLKETDTCKLSKAVTTNRRLISLAHSNCNQNANSSAKERLTNSPFTRANVDCHQRSPCISHVQIIKQSINKYHSYVKMALDAAIVHCARHFVRACVKRLVNESLKN